MIALVDYGMGNLRSVEKALTRVGGDVRIVSDRKAVLAADALVLPGVGAFGDCMANFGKAGLIEAIREFIATKRPFLGICLGFQALFESSEEAPGVKGLAAFPGSVPRFHFNGVVAGFTPAEREADAPVKGAATGGGLKVPHMGWNQLRIQKRDCPLLRGIETVGRLPSGGAGSDAASEDADAAYNGVWVYFVHSYYCKPKNATVVCATTEYGVEFCSMLWADNVFATQFHPEKSQAVGLKMLENFVGLAKVS